MDTIITRIKDTNLKSGLSRYNTNNIKKAFQIKDKINLEQMKILLVDDIYTTGTTINYCSTYLKEEQKKFTFFLLALDRICKGVIV